MSWNRRDEQIIRNYPIHASRVRHPPRWCCCWPGVWKRDWCRWRLKTGPVREVNWIPTTPIPSTINYWPGNEGRSTNAPLLNCCWLYKQPTRETTPTSTGNRNWSAIFSNYCGSSCGPRLPSNVPSSWALSSPSPCGGALCRTHIRTLWRRDRILFWSRDSVGAGVRTNCGRVRSSADRRGRPFPTTRNRSGASVRWCCSARCCTPPWPRRRWPSAPGRPSNRPACSSHPSSSVPFWLTLFNFN